MAKISLEKRVKLKKDLIHAPLWKRVFAYFIDAIIVNLVIFPPFKPYLSITVAESNSIFETLRSALSINLSLNMILISTSIAILTVLYWALLEWRLNQSIGKLVMGLYVVAEKKAPTFTQCLTRNITKISPFVLLLDCLYLFKTKNQRYFEKLSGTNVMALKKEVL